MYGDRPSVLQLAQESVQSLWEGRSTDCVLSYKLYHAPTWVSHTHYGFSSKVPVCGVSCRGGVPLRYWLFAPGLQWQPRGKRRISPGCARVAGEHARAGGAGHRASASGAARSAGGLALSSNFVLAFVLAFAHRPCRVHFRLMVLPPCIW